MSDTVREAALHQEVRRFVTCSGTTRALPTQVHVGQPGGPRVTVPVEARYDAALRADLLTRTLDGLGSDADIVCWLTRGGFPSIADQDLAWLVAADTAFARHGRLLAPFYVVTRHGWLEVRTGTERTWRRVRPIRASHQDKP